MFDRFAPARLLGGTAGKADLLVAGKRARLHYAAPARRVFFSPTRKDSAMQQEQFDPSPQGFEITEFPTEPAVGAGAGMFGTVCLLVEVAIIVVMIVGMWKVFEKAGKPGWASIIPFYNLYVLTEIAGRPILWFILLLIPCVNIVAHIVISIDIAKNFGKDTVYAIGLILFPFIFWPLLGFGDAKYTPLQHAQ
jgi:hypothetical protein